MQFKHGYRSCFTEGFMYIFGTSLKLSLYLLMCLLLYKDLVGHQWWLLLTQASTNPEWNLQKWLTCLFSQMAFLSFFFWLYIGSGHFAACLFLLDMISWRWGATKNLFCFDMIFHCPDLPPPQLALEQQSYWLQIIFSVLPVLFARCCCWLTACTHKNTTFYLFNLNFYHF